MTQLDMLDPATGSMLRDAGMEQVAEHNTDWSVNATRMLEEEFAKLMPTCLFTGEDLHQSLEERGLEEPLHANAWAAVIGKHLRRWLKAGLIEREGAITAHRPAAHCRLIQRYRKGER